MDGDLPSGLDRFQVDCGRDVLTPISSLDDPERSLVGQFRCDAQHGFTAQKRTHGPHIDQRLEAARSCRQAPPRSLGVRQKFASTFMQRQVWPAADIKMHLPRINVPLADIELLMCAFNRCKNNECFPAEQFGRYAKCVSMTLWSPSTGSWHDRSNEPGKGWPRHNGLQSRSQRKHADEQREAKLDFGLGPRE
jgi:hypothetical protein